MSADRDIPPPLDTTAVGRTDPAHGGTPSHTDQAKPTPEELEHRIAQQREELAHTVDALQHKLDVKSQAQERAAELKDRATTAEGKPRPELVGGAVAAAVLIVAVALWRRRR